MICLRNISFKYNNAKSDTLKDINFDLKKGNILAVVGPSGGGKSTLLRVISGLEEPTKGNIIIDDTDMTYYKPEKRGVGMLFQDYALFPHLTVEKNILYGVTNKQKKVRSSLVQSMLELVNMSGYEKRYPHQLSGGQQQRIALARALAPNPKVLLLDEPFSNLDTELVSSMSQEMFAIINKMNITTIMVTHNYENISMLADQIIKINDGRIEKI